MLINSLRIIDNILLLAINISLDCLLVKNSKYLFWYFKIGSSILSGRLFKHGDINWGNGSNIDNSPVGVLPIYPLIPI